MIVVKVGGGSEIDQTAFVRDLAQHDDWVLVHGGAHELNALSEKLGHPPTFVTSVSGHESRYTDRETLEMFNMVYAGKVNKNYVEMVQQAGVNAVGLTGLDGRLVEGKRKSSLKVMENGRKRVLRGDHSGTIETVNVDLLQLLIEAGYAPVLTPPAISHEGEAINVDGDRFAAKVAEALGADALLLLSDVPGLMRDL
ncbi:MAG: [LysW]-aminoadipate kinase, partial [Candidatus Bipolaricaulia bacterium]